MLWVLNKSKLKICVLLIKEVSLTLKDAFMKHGHGFIFTKEKEKLKRGNVTTLNIQ